MGSTYKYAGMTDAPDCFERCPPFLERYLQYLSTFENKKPPTVIEAYTTLLEFCQYVHYRREFRETPSTKDAHKDMGVIHMGIEEVCSFTQEDIERYLNFLETVARNAGSTLRKKITILRSFYRYLLKNATDLKVSLTENPLSHIVSPPATKRPARILSQKQAAELIDGCAGITALRDRTIILLILTTGLSLSELVMLNIEDIQEQTLRIHREGTPYRQVYLTDAANASLREYLREIDREEGPLFTAPGRTNRITARNVADRLKRAARLAGLPEELSTPQVLRDTAATMLMDAGSDTAELARYLGYRKPASIQRLTNDSIKSALRSPSLNGLGRRAI